MKSLLLAPALLICVVFTSCNNTSTKRPTGSGLAAYRAYNVPATMPKNRSAVKVKVSVKNQAAYVMEGSQPLLVMPISVGKTGTPTPKGNFRIFNKHHKRRANTHGFAYSGGQFKQTYLSKKPSGWSFKGTPMPYWSEFKPAYGFHTGWMKPYPCTHGCIRMHENVSPKFFKIISQGTPVYIADSQPEDATIGRNIPRPPDAGPLRDYPPNYYISDRHFTNHQTPTFR